jgi:hypothetical protein
VSLFNCCIIVCLFVAPAPLFREHGSRLIEHSNSEHAGALAVQIASAQKAAQAQKLAIEKFIGTTKAASSSPCSSRQAAAASRRHLSPRGVAA